MAGLKALDEITGWISKFFKRKDEKREKDTGKAVMSGDERTLRDATDKLYPK